MPSVVDLLTSALGPDVVQDAPELLDRHARDWSVVAAQRPLAVLRPRTTAEGATALRICNAHGQGVATQGGRTGGSGGPGGTTAGGGPPTRSPRPCPPIAPRSMRWPGSTGWPMAPS